MGSRRGCGPIFGPQFLNGTLRITFLLKVSGSTPIIQFFYKRLLQYIFNAADFISLKINTPYVVSEINLIWKVGASES